MLMTLDLISWIANAYLFSPLTWFMCLTFTGFNMEFNAA